MCVCEGGSSGYRLYLLQTVLVKLLFESNTELAVVVGGYLYSWEEILLGLKRPSTAATKEVGEVYCGLQSRITTERSSGCEQIPLVVETVREG